MVAQRYGQRPSGLIGLKVDDVLALDFDIAIALRGMQVEKEALDRAKPKTGIDAEELTGGLMF